VKKFEYYHLPLYSQPLSSQVIPLLCNQQMKAQKRMGNEGKELLEIIFVLDDLCVYFFSRHP